MNILISLDPGLRGCGLAFFDLDHKLLLKARYVKSSLNNPTESVMLSTIENVVHEVYNTLDFLNANPGYLSFVYEMPQVYREKHLKGDPNDLLPLAAVGVGISYALYKHCEAFSIKYDTKAYLPRQWKGQIPKETVYKARLQACFVASEISKIADDGALTHNTLDAVGIGLYAIGRFEPYKVFAK